MCNTENNEILETPIFTSSYTLTKEKYHSFCSVNYRKRIFIYSIILPLVLMVYFSMVMLLLIGEDYYTLSTIALLSVVTMLPNLQLLFFEHYGYKRLLTAQGGAHESCETALYPSEILCSRKSGKCSYKYESIKQIKENKDFLLLQMKYNLYLLIDKQTLNADPNEVCGFLLNTCPCLKKRKIINIEKDSTIVAILASVLLLLDVSMLIFYVVYLNIFF